MAILLAVTDLGPRPGTGPAFLSAVLSNGRLFPLAAIAIVLPLFLPVAVAVIAGDAIAGEAQAGTLRYLLIRPVGRTRLLVAKLVAVVRVRGARRCCSSPDRLRRRATPARRSRRAASRPASPATTPSPRPSSPSGPRCRSAYAVLSMLGVAAMAVFLSTVTDTPLAASMGALALLIASTLLLTLDAATSLQPYLPTRYWLSFVDLFRDPILWRDVPTRRCASRPVYACWCSWGPRGPNFTTKDITS